MSNEALTPSDADTDMRRYTWALAFSNHEVVVMIEKRWSLYGYSPEVVSTVLSCLASGLPRDAAIREATS